MLDRQHGTTSPTLGAPAGITGVMSHGIQSLEVRRMSSQLSLLMHPDSVYLTYPKPKAPVPSVMMLGLRHHPVLNLEA